MRNHICELPECNCRGFQRYNKILLCAKHYSQMKNHGKILERTIFDKNEIIEDGEIAYIVLYDKKCNEVGRTIIDSKNVDIVKVANLWY